MTIKHILTFLLLTLTLPIFAQQQVEIIGTVSGEYDQALEFVTISQVDTFNSTQTDEKDWPDDNKTYTYILTTHSNTTDFRSTTS